MDRRSTEAQREGDMLAAQQSPTQRVDIEKAAQVTRVVNMRGRSPGVAVRLQKKKLL